MDIIALRLRQRREEKGHSQETLAAAAGVSQSTISAIEDGTTKEPRTLPKIARALDTPVEFFTDEKYPFPPETIHDPENQPSRETIRQTFPPHVPSQHTQEPIGAVLEIDARVVGEEGTWGPGMTHSAVAKWLLPPELMRFELRTAPEQAVFLEVTGDAMTPTLNAGDRALIDTMDRDPEDDGLFAIERGKKRLVRRLEIIPGSEPEQVNVKADNPRHSSFTLPRSAVRVIGRVVGRFQKL